MSTQTNSINHQATTTTTTTLASVDVSSPTSPIHKAISIAVGEFTINEIETCIISVTLTKHHNPIAKPIQQPQHHDTIESTIQQQQHEAIKPPPPSSYHPKTKKHTTKKNPTKKRQAILGQLLDEEILLQQQFPNLTKETRRRFLIARHGDADATILKLQLYCDWLTLHGFHAGGKEEEEEDVWGKAATLALLQTKEELTKNISLPCLVYFNSTLIDLQNTKTIQVLPSKLNPSLVTPSTYAQTLSLYLQYTLDAHSMEQISVFVDLRSREGWYNPTPSSCLSLLKEVAKLLGTHHPERLKRCIVFPLPKASVYVWNTVVKYFLDGNTAKKFVILGGGGKELGEYFSGEVLDALEDNRRLF
uniref:CRAL-TRIO domain-containing protein n=1 Tax=Ditylum brightwellii TaxID=49249 RepID=A0A6U3WXK5_9STRA|mmetsp:Transcript_19848/g.29599  ORF Transcript_19848/g.29599 Transcript_19848/m.29599 type:complete len:361 (+) Transcript_19848:221-1303(+)